MAREGRKGEGGEERGREVGLGKGGREEKEGKEK